MYSRIVISQSLGVRGEKGSDQRGDREKQVVKQIGLRSLSLDRRVLAQ